ncbi:MAG: tRNA pseudouridine(13) synthase TruD, partial [Candidatus Eremiobacterota bacterium]
GLKDRHAVTTQRLSIPATAADLLGQTAEVEGLLDLKVLGLHANKLRRGHLRGNRFRLRLRGCAEDAEQRARAVAAWLGAHGWANFFGSQRFGHGGRNLHVGLRGLQSGRIGAPTWKRTLLISAVQAELFNRYALQRIADGLFERILPGELCALLPSGGLFRTDDPDREEGRMRRFELSATGPIFGFKMMRPASLADEREQALLAESGLRLEQFRPFKAQGSRRRLRLALPEVEILQESDGLALEFELPAGSYATVLAEEFIKSEVEVEESELLAELA